MLTLKLLVETDMIALDMPLLISHFFLLMLLNLIVFRNGNFGCWWCPYHCSFLCNAAVLHHPNIFLIIYSFIYSFGYSFICVFLIIIIF
jgi:hypothetical protein